MGLPRPRLLKLRVHKQGVTILGVGIKIPKTADHFPTPHFKHYITYPLGRVLGQKLAFCLVDTFLTFSNITMSFQNIFGYVLKNHET